MDIKYLRALNLKDLGKIVQNSKEICDYGQILLAIDAQKEPEKFLKTLVFIDKFHKELKKLTLLPGEPHED
jgi:hypothetical protein